MAESKVRDDNYFMVSGWMLNRLNLRGVALQVFSIIYGFSQDGEGSFTGSLQYLMDFTNSSKHTVIKALKELVEKGYVLKLENTINGVKFCTYKTAPVVQKLHRGSAEIALGGGAETAPGGSAETAPNKKDYINNISDIKDIYTEITELYHSICVSFPSVRQLSEPRKKAIQNLLKTYTLEDFRTVFENAEKSSFLKGAKGGWKASFDWLLKEANFLKVLEGNYADKCRKEVVPGWMSGERQIDSEEALAIQRMMAEPDPELAERAERLRRELGGHYDG